MNILILFFILLLTPPPESYAIPNLHEIHSLPNGYSIYRYGIPKKKEAIDLCRMGIAEVYVLSGDAKDIETTIPCVHVLYNTKQSAKEALTKSFLVTFDKWVDGAITDGRKIAFRCDCGCHRTGRLAAYYQMKYQGLTADDAIAIMKKNGKYMAFFPQLDEQVRALNDYIKGKPCSQKKQYCVQMDK